MAGRKENGGSADPEGELTPSQLGELTFDAIDQITTHLENIPEFPEGKGFFATVPDGEMVSRGFIIGDERYHIQYSLTTLDRDSRKKRMLLCAQKYVPSEPDAPRPPMDSMVWRSNFQPLDAPIFYDGFARILAKSKSYSSMGITALREAQDAFGKLFPPKR